MRMEPAESLAKRQRPRNSGAEAPAAQRRGVRLSPRAVVAAGHSSAKASEGILKGAKGPLEPALLLPFLQEQKRKGPRAA